MLLLLLLDVRGLVGRVGAATSETSKKTLHDCEGERGRSKLSEEAQNGERFQPLQQSADEELVCFMCGGERRNGQTHDQ